MNLKRFIQLFSLILVFSTSIKPIGNFINRQIIECIRGRMNLRAFMTLMPNCMALPQNRFSVAAWQGDPRPCARTMDCTESRVAWAANQASESGSVAPVINAILANQPCMDAILDMLDDQRFKQCGDIPLLGG